MLVYRTKKQTYTQFDLKIHRRRRLRVCSFPDPVYHWLTRRLATTTAYSFRLQPLAKKQA